jgi:isopentenyldiphosphate isomerase
MEMIDVLNPDGSRTGTQVSKKEAHIKGLWHRSAHVWFVNKKGEILLQKRAANIESHPGEYDISAAGHLTAGDTQIMGALREIKEELGLDLEEKDLIKIGEVKNESVQRGGAYINKEYNDIYVVHTDIPAEDFILQESEVELVKYIPTEELKSWIAEEKKDLVMHPEEFKILFAYLDTKKF